MDIKKAQKIIIEFTDKYEGNVPVQYEDKYDKALVILNDNADKLIEYFFNYNKNHPNKYTKNEANKIGKDILTYEIVSKDEIPKHEKETIKKPSSTLAKLKEEVNELIPTLTSAQKKLIVKIPHDTYTAKNIYQIIKYIHSGEIKKESDFPKPGKGDKVNLEDLIPIKNLTLSDKRNKSV